MYCAVIAGVDLILLLSSEDSNQQKQSASEKRYMYGSMGGRQQHDGDFHLAAKPLSRKRPAADSASDVAEKIPIAHLRNSVRRHV